MITKSPIITQSPVLTKPERGSVIVEVDHYKYSNAVADTLKGLNFSISKGEFIGLMGRTGAGKTTSLMLLNGLIPHFFEGDFKGKVLANTMNTQRYRIQTLARFIGLVMQDTETQIFGITVEKDVAFGPSNLRYGKEKIHELVGKSLKAVGLSGYEKRITTELSGGEKQRLTIAGVLAMEPEILVLDEPTSELDPEGRLEIYKLLSSLRKENEVTIIISGHDSEEMLQFTDKILVLEHGSICWQGKPGELFSDVKLTESFGIRPTEVSEIRDHLSSNGQKENLPVCNSIDQLVEYISQSYCFKPSSNLALNSTAIKNSSQSDRPVVIKAVDLNFLYTSSKIALRNINLEIHKGEFVALIGKNGAGKTTFSKHLNGLLRPSFGDVFINGRNIKTVSTSELSKEVGYVFQNPDHQIFSSTLWDEVEYGLKNLGISENDRKTRVMEALKFVGLEELKERHPFTLGKGERQKLAVATILAMETEILVIDEPTTGQDWEGTKRMMTMMEKLHKRGHTILAITHNMRLAAEYANRVIVFANGQIVLDGPPEEVFYEQEKLQKASVTPPESAIIGNRLRSYGLEDFPVTISALVDQLCQKSHGEINVN
ncbi:MAG: energy-coupling factor transporter ATPase [Bacteroidota bacterium]|nr:energy-coupling factor transporter ATPase [Bacteroidota bacterium]